MSFSCIITTIGQAKVAAAIASGIDLPLIEMAIGDGNGNATTPTAGQTTLVRERYRSTLGSVGTDPAYPNRVVAEMTIPRVEGGWVVREVGIFDDTGALIAVANYPDTYKPIPAEGSARDMTIRVLMQIANSDSVTLGLDPSGVFATQSWVTANFAIGVQAPGGTTGQVLRKTANADGTVGWVDPTAAISVIVDVLKESQTLATDQLIIDWANINTNGLSLYIGGIREEGFTVNSSTRITLSRSYPAGTQVYGYQNTPINPSYFARRDLINTFAEDQTFNKNIFVKQLAATSAYVCLDGGSGNTGDLVLQAGPGSADFGGSVRMFGRSHATNPGDLWLGPSSGAGDIRFGVGTHTGNSERMRLARTGELGIGVVPTAGNGLLQFAAGTTKANGIGLGVDSFIYRAGQNTLTIANTPSANGALIGMHDVTSGQFRGFIGYGNNIAGGSALSDFGIGSVGALKLATNGGETALTIDTSQTSTFAGASPAGQITNGTAVIGNGEFWAGAPGDIPVRLITARGFGYETTSYRATVISGGNGAISLGVDVSTIAGGGFHGGDDIVVKRNAQIIIPNAGGTDFIRTISLEPSGCVGIGPTAPTSGNGTLQVFGTSSAWVTGVVTAGGGVVNADAVGIGFQRTGGNGLLQLATGTTKAYGIGFGTDTFMFRNAAGYITLQSASAESSLYVYDSTGATLTRILSNASGGYIGTGTNKALYIQTNGTAAISVGTDQNCTFAGQINVIGTPASPVAGRVIIGSGQIASAAPTSGGYAFSNIYQEGAVNYVGLFQAGSAYPGYFGVGNGGGSLISVNEHIGVGTYTAHDLVLGTLNTERMRVSASGMVTTTQANCPVAYHTGLIYVSTPATAPSVVNTTSAGTLFSATCVGTRTLPANCLTVGRTVRVTIMGTVTWTGTPSLTIVCTLGSAGGPNTPAITLPVSANAKHFRLEVIYTVITAGAAGKYNASMMMSVGDFAGFGANAMTAGNITNSAIDTTSSKLVDVQAQWSVASGSNGIYAENVLVELLG